MNQYHYSFHINISIENRRTKFKENVKCYMEIGQIWKKKKGEMHVDATSESI